MNTLIAKLAAASTAVGALMPDKTNTAQNYSYISADKILQRAGDALSNQGIVILPRIVNESVTEISYTDGYGKAKTRYDAIVNFEMLIMDGESELMAFWAGRGSDFFVPDKAMYKAITSGHKYFIAKLLNVGVGNEDGEHETEAAQDAAKPQQAKAASKPIEEPASTRARANADQLKEINRLGMLVYPKEGEWVARQPKWAEEASGGARNTIKQLYDMEAATIIEWLDNRLQARLVQVAQDAQPIEA